GPEILRGCAMPGIQVAFRELIEQEDRPVRALRKTRIPRGVNEGRDVIQRSGIRHHDDGVFAQTFKWLDGGHPLKIAAPSGAGKGLADGSAVISLAGREFKSSVDHCSPVSLAPAEQLVRGRDPCSWIVDGHPALRLEVA